MIEVAITSWPNSPRRLHYFKTVAGALLDGLSASRHKLRFLCSSESHPLPGEQWCGDELAGFCAANAIELHWRDKPPSMGGNCNDLLALCRAPFILMMQDDWLLKAPLDLSDGADLMRDDPTIDMIRYSYGQGSHKPEFDEYRDDWRQFRLHSPWPYGMDPHMIRGTFVEKWGPFHAEPNSVACEGDMLWRLVGGNARILAADRQYFYHRGQAGGIGNVAAALYKVRRKQ